MDGIIYLLHFDRPIGNPVHPKGQAQHYLGWCDNLARRLDDHRRGHPQAAAITRHLVQQRIGFTVVRCWLGTRTEERRLKLLRRGPDLCPICAAQRGQRLVIPPFALPEIAPAQADDPAAQAQARGDPPAEMFSVYDADPLHCEGQSSYR